MPGSTAAFSPRRAASRSALRKTGWTLTSACASSSRSPLVGVNYDFSKTFAGKFGYRYLSVDYDKNGFLYDMTNSGFYLGLGIRF